MSRRDHTSSRLKGHDPGRNQCPVFCEARGRSEATRGNWGIQKQPILVYTQSETQGKSDDANFKIVLHYVVVGPPGLRWVGPSGSGRCFKTCRHEMAFFQSTRAGRQKRSARSQPYALRVWSEKKNTLCDSVCHSSEIRSLCLIKCSSKTLQNLLYFWNMKTHVVFFVFHFVLLYFFPNKCHGLCRHRPGHPLGTKWKTKKTT